MCNPSLNGSTAAAAAAGELGVRVLVGGPSRRLRQLVDLARAS